MKKYEAIIIIHERLNEEEIDKALDGIKAEVANLGGQADNATRMGRKTFARPMKKCTVGEYALMRFELDPANVVKLHENLKLNEDLFRMQVIARNEKKSA